MLIFLLPEQQLQLLSVAAAHAVTYGRSHFRLSAYTGGISKCVKITQESNVVWLGAMTAIRRIRRELRYYRALQGDTRTPLLARWLIRAGVGYLVLPLDLIPDVIPVIGQLDDLLVVSLLIGAGLRLVPQEVKTDNRRRTRGYFAAPTADHPRRLYVPTHAISGSFGVRSPAGNMAHHTLGLLSAALVTLIDEHELAVIPGLASHPNRLRRAGTRPRARERRNWKSRPSLISESVDANCAVFYCESDFRHNIHFVNLAAAFTALPTAVQDILIGSYLSYSPRSSLSLTLNEIKSPGLVSTPKLSGAQMLLFVLHSASRIDGMNSRQWLQFQDRCKKWSVRGCFQASCRPSRGDLLVWNLDHVRALVPSDSPLAQGVRVLCRPTRNLDRSGTDQHKPMH